MPKFKPLVDAKGEVRELTAADMKRFRPAHEALPDTLLTKIHITGSAEGADQGTNHDSSFS